MKGLWNSRLCELFIEYCRKEGYTESEFTTTDEGDIREIFFSRLSSLKTLLQRHKPKKEETQAIAMERAKAKLHASAV